MKKIEDSIDFVNSRPKPLAAYAFTNDSALKKRIVSETSSGSLTFNDAIVQVTQKIVSLFVLLVSCRGGETTALVIISLVSVPRGHAAIRGSRSERFRQIPREVLV